jgi:hypothetical protein
MAVKHNPAVQRVVARAPFFLSRLPKEVSVKPSRVDKAHPVKAAAPKRFPGVGQDDEGTAEGVNSADPGIVHFPGEDFTRSPRDGLA